MKTKRRDSFGIFVSAITVVLVAASVFAPAALTNAQSESAAPAVSQTNAPTRVATVNIQNAKIVSQQANAIGIEFDVTNREVVQHGVQYAVVLIDRQNKKTIKLDQYIYSETLTLEEHSSVHKSITYIGPPSLEGTYEVMLTSTNNLGLLLANVVVGKVTFKATSGIFIDPSSCYLSVAGEPDNKRYSLVPGVDIAAGEILQLTCTAVNRSGNQITAQPKFETYETSLLGDTVAHTGGGPQSVTFASRESKTITFSLPQVSKPQAYTALVSLKTDNERSNAVDVFYVVQGESATIMNLTFDNNLYRKGDMAKVSFLWFPSADTAIHARAGTSSPTATSFRATLTDGRGKACAEEVLQPLTYQHVTGISLAVTRMCVDPTLSITLIGASGSVLAEHSLMRASPPGTASSSPLTNIVLLMILLAGLVVACAYVLARYRSHVRTGLKVIVFFGILAAGSITTPNVAHADTWYDYGGNVSTWAEALGSGYWPAFMITANIDKNTYAINEPINLTMTINGIYYPGLSYPHYVPSYAQTLSAGVIPSDSTVGSLRQASFLHGPFPGQNLTSGPYSDAGFTAPSTAGSYNFWVIALVSGTYPPAWGNCAYQHSDMGPMDWENVGAKTGVFCKGIPGWSNPQIDFPITVYKCVPLAPSSEDGLGHKILSGLVDNRVDRSGYRFCVSNSGGTSYFLPAKTSNEIQSFLNAVYRLSGVSTESF